MSLGSGLWEKRILILQMGYFYCEPNNAKDFIAISLLLGSSILYLIRDQGLHNHNRPSYRRPLRTAQPSCCFCPISIFPWCLSLCSILTSIFLCFVPLYFWVLCRWLTSHSSSRCHCPEEDSLGWFFSKASGYYWKAARDGLESGANRIRLSVG